MCWDSWGRKVGHGWATELTDWLTVFTVRLPFRSSFYSWYSTISLQHIQMQTFVYIALYSVYTVLRLTYFFMFEKFLAFISLNIFPHLAFSSSKLLLVIALEISSILSNDFNLPWTFPVSSSLYYSLVKFLSLMFYFISLVWVCPMYGLNWEFWSPFCILQWYGFLFKSISLVLDTYLFFFLNSHLQQYSIYLAVYLLFILISLWELYSYFWSLFPIA